METTVRDATQEDFDYIRQNPVEDALRFYPPIKVDGPAKAGLYNGVLLGCGGVVEFWPGCGEGWIAMSRNCMEYSIPAFYCVKKITDGFMTDLKLKRLQATARVDFPKAKYLLEALGFECEGIMKNYLPDGADAYIYAKFSKEF